MTKMTKKDYYQILRESYPVDAENYDEVIAFIDHQVELLSKKNGSGKKLTSTQKQNVIIKETILGAMERNHLYSIGELNKGVEALQEYSGQKISALMKQLIADGKVERVEDHRKAFFSLV